MGTLRRPGSTCCPLSRRRYRPRRPAWKRCPWTRHGSRAPRPAVPPGSAAAGLDALPLDALPLDASRRPQGLDGHGPATAPPSTATATALRLRPRRPRPRLRAPRAPATARRLRRPRPRRLPGREGFEEIPPAAKGVPWFGTVRTGVAHDVPTDRFGRRLRTAAAPAPGSAKRIERKSAGAGESLRR